MAQYKACCPVIAPIVSEQNDTITYGQGMVLDRMMNVKVSPEYDSPVIYADDDVAEHMDLFKQAGIELGTTTIPVQAENSLFGNTYDEEKNTITDKDSDNGQYVGCGFFICERINGVDVYKMHWYKKVKFRMPSDEFETRGETISFKTPVISGTAKKDVTGEWRVRELCGTAALAKEKLFALAHITTTTTTTT